MKAPHLTEDQAARLIVASRDLAEAAFNRGNTRSPAKWAKRLEAKAKAVDAALADIPSYAAVALPDPANVRQDRTP